MSKKPPKHIPGKGTWLDVTKFDPSANPDSLAINGIDCIEIFVSNGKQTVYYFTHAFGFQPIAYRGPETGYKDHVNYVLRQNDVTLVVGAPLRSNHAIASEVFEHGVTVKNIALNVPDCQAFYYEAMKRGAESVEVPTRYEDEDGSVVRAGIKTYGNVIHSIAQREDYKGIFWPGYKPIDEIFDGYRAVEPRNHFENIDHVVGNVERMEEWTNFYAKVLGFSEMVHFTDKDISTKYSALMSKVMNDGTGKIKFPINEPADGLRKSQIQEYLEAHQGAGVQHIALATKDIIETVTTMRQHGVEFLHVPDTYYEDLPDRIGPIKEDLQKLAKLGILVDRDEDGYLLQIFTRPAQDRPTLFFEIIQREGSGGFGVGNFKALFEALEREQDRRGNL